MTFDDEGILVEAKPFGEGDLVVRMLSKDHGLFAGLVKGGNSKRQRASLEIGGSYSFLWKARLEDSLGTMAVELTSPLPSIDHLDDADRLLGLQALCQILATSLTEREPVPDLYAAARIWLSQLSGDTWVHTLALLELRLLGLLGFGLDLTRCASTGQTDDLVYVSPRSGRAVSAKAGEPYKDRLLALPRFLIGQTATDFEQDGIDALALTGRFLEERVYAAQNKDVPWSRRALFDRLTKEAREYGAAGR